MGDIPLDRGDLFKFGSFENRKGAAKPRPLCTPLGLFFSSARDSLFLFVDLCLYASVFSALRCADVVLFPHFLRDSLLARCLYSSVFSALRYADIILFLHFLSDSLLAKCPYASMFNMLRCADIFHFFTFSMIHFWQGVCMLRYSAHYALQSLALNLRRGEAGCWW